MMMVDMLIQMPDLRRRIQADHVADATGHCRDCPGTQWPCQLHQMATEADQRCANGAGPLGGTPRAVPSGVGSRPDLPVQVQRGPLPDGRPPMGAPGALHRPAAPVQRDASMPGGPRGGMPPMAPPPPPRQAPGRAGGPSPRHPAGRRLPAYNNPAARPAESLHGGENVRTAGGGAHHVRLRAVGPDERPGQPGQRLVPRRAERDRLPADALSGTGSHALPGTRADALGELPAPRSTDEQPRHLIGLPPPPPPPAPKQELIDVLEDVLRWSR
jgi:hypothetical protein